MEIEAKYAVTGSLSPQTLDALDLAPYTLRPGEDLEHHDIVLDTPERAITGSRHSLRVRDENGRKILTLKGPGRVNGSVHQREELEAPLPEGESEDELYDYTTWPSAIAAPVARMAGLHPLSPLVEMRVHRQTWIVERAGRQIGELALDEGTIEAKGATESVHELELELKDAGTQRDLRMLDARLRKRLPLAPEPRSKLERGLALLGATTEGGEHTKKNGAKSGRSREPASTATTAEVSDQRGDSTVAAPAQERSDDLQQRGRPPTTEPQPESEPEHRSEQQSEHQTITGHTTLQLAARHAVKRYLIKLRKHEPKVRHGEDPEDVHDMRVATRRIRSALGLLENAPSFDRKHLLKMRRHLSALSHELGAVRDLDIFLGRLKEYEDEHPADHAGLRALRKELERRRETARAKLLHELGAAKLVRRLTQVDDFATQRVEIEDEPRPALVRSFAGGAIWRRYEEVLSYECELPSAPPPELHQLRIACKRLRYAIEMFEPALGGGAKLLLEALVAVQDHLGALQDTIVAIETVDQLRGHDRHTGAGNHGLTHEERTALGAYADTLALHRDELKRDFAPLWAQISDEPFRAALAALIAEL
jgi:inorganic triphosphatase YgiF